jgi:hypothetical protein
MMLRLKIELVDVWICHKADLTYRLRTAMSAYRVKAVTAHYPKAGAIERAALRGGISDELEQCRFFDDTKPHS